MKKRKIILFSSITLAVVLLMASLTYYAWYIYTGTLGQMEFSILQIQSQVALYEGTDSNYNGVPDELDSGNIGKYKNENTSNYIDYAKAYYEEDYEFKYKDQRYSLVADSESNLLSQITITGAAPSKIYTYKFEIINYSECINDVSFGFEASTIDASTLAQIECRLGSVELDKSITFSDWTSLSDSAVSLVPKANLQIPKFSTGTSGTTLDVGRLDLWLQIRIKSDTVTPIGLDSEFTLPSYRLTLAIPE